MRKAVLTFIILALTSPCFAKYSGGSGEPNDPYQIADVTDLLILAADTNDYNKCFILTADIDLDPNLPEGQVFTTALIAPDTNGSNYVFDGTPFIGVFDGLSHRIFNFTIDTNTTFNDYLGLFGDINSGEVKNLGLQNVTVIGEYDSVYIGGLAGQNELGNISNCFSTGIVANGWYSGEMGGLVGKNCGNIRNCYSTCDVRGGFHTSCTGGLVGHNEGNISESYSMGDATSISGGPIGYVYIGGLAGYNKSIINKCYSTGAVSDMGHFPHPGGLVGYSDQGTVLNSFWDVNTSGQTTSAGGTGKTTDEMQTQSTFTDARWDFVGETANGYYDFWRMCNEGLEYPKLAWQYLSGDIVCPDGVDIYDLNELCEQWLFDEIPADLAPPPAGDGIVDFADFAIFADQWGITNDIEELLDFTGQWLKIGLSICSADISPLPDGDGRVDAEDFAIMANDWLEGF